MSAIPPKVIAVTPGEPAGIGPELCMRLATQPRDFALVLVADPGLLAERARLLGVDAAPAPWSGRANAGTGLYVLPVPLTSPAQPGRLDARNAPYVIATLARAIDGCRHGEFDALVTAPVHKGIINDAGIPFIEVGGPRGHDRCRGPSVRRQVQQLLDKDGAAQRAGRWIQLFLPGAS